LILFKAMMDDTEYYDPSSEMYYVQADYDQRPNPVCPGGQELCILGIDATNGALISVVKSNYTVYKWAGEGGTSPTSALGWIEGMQFCSKTSQSGFLFGEVNLETGDITPGPCVPDGLVIQEQPWISGFSNDGSLFATGSRFSDDTQFLVLDVGTGGLLVNTTLPGLAQKLGNLEKNAA